MISYARPFSANRETGGNDVKYQMAHLKNVNGFDRSLHNHLLDLRHKMIAHHDSEYLAAKLLSNLIVTGGIDFLVGVSVHVKSLYSIEDRQIPEQYAVHFDAVISAIYAAMRRDLGMYFQAGQQWIGVLKSTAQSSHETGEFTVGPGEQCAVPNSLGIELGRLPAPALRISSNGYSYREMRHLLMMEGKINVTGAGESTVLEIRSTPRPTQQTDR